MSELPIQLRQHETVLRRLNAMDRVSQAIDYHSEHWIKFNPANADLQSVMQQYPKAITRGDIAELAYTADTQRNSVSVRQLFIGAMLFGYGTVGYGPYRVSKMLGASNASEMLISTLKLVLQGQTREAYVRFRLPMCGSAFFTKFFYFVGLSRKLRPRPLILDTAVANVLERWLRIDVSQLARFSRDKKTGMIDVLDRDPDGYDRYLRLLNGWGEELQCAPDSIELFLFTQSRFSQKEPVSDGKTGEGTAELKATEERERKRKKERYVSSSPVNAPHGEEEVWELVKGSSLEPMYKVLRSKIRERIPDLQAEKKSGGPGWIKFRNTSMQARRKFCHFDLDLQIRTGRILISFDDNRFVPAEGAVIAKGLDSSAMHRKSAKGFYLTNVNQIDDELIRWLEKAL